MSDLKLKTAGERELAVVDGDKIVASVKLDYQQHMREVVLRASTSDEIQLQVLRLVVQRVHQFVRKLTAEQINKLDRDALTKDLNAVGIDISFALYKDAKEAIDVAVEKAGILHLRYREMQSRRGLDDNLRLEFTVDQPNRFVFWKNESQPSRDYEGLHIVPGYHPVMNGWQEVGLVNGDTDAYIRGSAVRGIYCPSEAQTGNDLQYKGSSWSHVNHPFRAEGQDMQLEVDTTKLRSAEGVDELVQALRASLGLDNRYVAISGGFRPPLESAHNRLVRTKRRSPYPQADHSGRGHLARGSEDHCVWAYRTLETEGALDKAFVPAWFKREGWLDIYEGAEIKPGIY